MKLGAVVPAAGRSLRMGSEKVLLPFAGSTMLGTVLSKLSEAGVARSVVVLRPDSAEAHLIARAAGAEIVINPHPEDEMLVSIRLGIEPLEGAVDVFFVWPADHPAVSTATLRELASRASRDLAVIPVHSGRRGHPAIVGTDLLADMARIRPSAGLRQLWRDRADRVRELEVDDPGILENLDDPETYERVRRRAERELRERGGDFAGKSE
ncbi:MAG TPA: nucleotidyltransferase family protein [Thermoanaerobaculia bacterium]